MTDLVQTTRVERTISLQRQNQREGIRSNTFSTTPGWFTGNVDAWLAYWAVMKLDCAAVSWPTYEMTQPSLCRCWTNTNLLRRNIGFRPWAGRRANKHRSFSFPKPLRLRGAPFVIRRRLRGQGVGLVIVEQNDLTIALSVLDQYPSAWSSSQP